MKRIGLQLPQVRIPTLVRGEITLLNLADFQGRWTIITYLPSWDFHEAVCLNQYQRIIQQAGGVLYGLLTETDPRRVSPLPKLKVLRVPLLTDPLNRLRRILGIDQDAVAAHRCHTFFIDPTRVVRYHLVHRLNWHGLSAVVEMLVLLRAGGQVQLVSPAGHHGAKRHTLLPSGPCPEAA